MRIEIDSNDWTCEKSRDFAVELFETKLEELSSEEYNSIAGFLYAEQASEGGFDFSNEKTNNEYADRMARLLHKLERDSLEEAIKDWKSYPVTGHNICCYVVID